ncbi:Catechol 2,3-dioxygenase [Eubacterium aggregans]|uniref:Catechol 2,3-dioxygenase n=1 Tax=Eubacterium aggregans TaxID=81409 RepID=A0A1H4EGS5_9FIRM|nr:VOC family protein [Eubacterium aggregans]SEA83928.1 Catechol 2,3-dioxygenase [Eubacterium aggregans]
MKFKLPLLAVQNVDVSKKFYQRFFDQDVVMDLGKNVTFSGGFAIQEDFPWLTDIDPSSVVSKSHNMELYFEVEDFNAFLKRLEGQESIVYVHPPKKHEWQQRVLRIYDPDGHMIEIGESMAVIARRYLAQGLSVEAVSEMIQHPVAFVESCILDDGGAVVGQGD